MIESKIILGLIISTIGSVLFIIVGKFLESYAKKMSGSKALGVLAYIFVTLSFYIYLLFYWLDLYEESLQ